MDSTINRRGDLRVVTGRCSSCGAPVALGTVGAKADCCTRGRVMAWRVQRQPVPRITDATPARPRTLSISGSEC
jgi:hypothetical protein